MWFVFSLFVPLFCAWTGGSTYSFELFLTLTGALLYVPIAFVADRIEKIKIAKLKAAAEGQILFQFDPDEIEPGTFVPRPLAVIGQIGLGWMLSGIITIILIWVGFIERMTS